MNIKTIEQAGKALIKLSAEYSNRPHREMLIDSALYGYLLGKSKQCDRQHYVHMTGSSHPKRIDFRIGGSNPVYIEFAMRSQKTGAELYGSQNKSELNKLCRVVQSKGKLRILLLVDVSGASIPKTRLQDTYAQVRSGRGKFARKSVRVVYVSANSSYHFVWKPL